MNKPTLRDLFSRHTFRSRQLAWVLVSVLGVVALLRWTAPDFSFGALAQNFLASDPIWVGITVCILVGGQLLRLIRWHSLLKLEMPLPRIQAGKALMDGQMINWLSPVRLGDVWRMWSVAQIPQRSVVWASASIVVEKSADAIVLAVMSTVLILAPVSTTVAPVVIRAALTGLVALLVLVALAALRPSRWLERARSRLPAMWQQTLGADRIKIPTHVEAQLQTTGFWLRLGLQSLGIWTLALLTNIALAQALSIQLTWPQQIMFLVALQLGLVLSVVPANLGLFPLVAIGMFGLFSIRDADGLVFGSLLYVLVYGVNLMLWLVFSVLLQINTRRQVVPDASDAGDGARPHVVRIGGVGVSATTRQGLLSRLESALSGARQETVMYANAHAVNLANDDPELMTALNRADIVFCDGRGVQIAAWLLGQPLPDRMTPPDWIADFAAICARYSAGMFLLGSQPGVADQAASQLRAAVEPGVLSTFTHHGYFEDADDDSVARRVNESGAAVLLVGMGMPRQEIWIARNSHRMPAVRVIVSVGALFDYVAGTVPRGPRWMTENGLEWLSRLWVEPRRLWRRYLLGNPRFVLQVIAQRFRKTGG
jgi:N-acetylglucosaminyldiphosphoundecaprenol N-acetyl-beta-D-mannosaminyltransferase